MGNSNLRALVADDEAIIALLVETALADAGFCVTGAESGVAALSALGLGKRFDLLVTDIRLGSGPQGWAVAVRARELNPEIRVIYITGDSMGDWAANGVPCSVVLSKPFESSQIVQAAEDLFRERC